MQRLIMADEFGSQNIRSQRIDKITSLGITILIHVVLILVFIYLFGFVKPDPPLSDVGGVELNIGNTDQGLGDEQVQGVPVSTSTDVQSASSPQINSPTPHVITQSVEPTAVVNNSTNTNSTTSTQTNNSTTTINSQTTTTQTTKPDPKPKFQYGSTDHGANTQGNTKPGGDQGNPNGSPFGNSYTGNPGNGNNPQGNGSTGQGATLTLTGRSIVNIPPITDKTQKAGIVNVMIKVDRKGNVIYAQATQKESTTFDPYLCSLAEAAALKTIVTPDPNAEEEQFGYLKFTFKLK